MIVWLVVLLIIAFSMLSGVFAEASMDFFVNHTLAILLVVIGLLYMMHIDRKRKMH
jgi:heme/copper-type cytochrome/quinol oxidase subunit 4